MNLGVGSLILVGFIFLVGGIATKAMGVSLFEPIILTSTGYFIAANTCLLLALIVDKFQKN